MKLIQAGYNLNWLKYSHLNEQIAPTVKLLYWVNPKHTVADKWKVDKWIAYEWIADKWIQS